MNDNNDLYNKSWLLYTIDLKDFIVRFNVVKEVFNNNETCIFNYQVKQDVLK